MIDASDPSHDDHYDTTERLLVDLGLERLPRLVVFNKADQLDPRRAAAIAASRDAVAVSAIHPKTMEPLLRRVERILAEDSPLDEGEGEGEGDDDESLAHFAP